MLNLQSMFRVSLPLILSGLVLVLLAPVSHARVDNVSTVLITGVYDDPFVAGEASEAIQIQNMSGAVVGVGNWTLGDGEGMVAFPEGASLEAGQRIWVSKSATAFLGEFGFLPAYEYGGNSDANVPDMTGSAPSLNNSGDQVILRDEGGDVVDAMVYGNASLSAPDWIGEGVQPYEFGSASVEGQILFRKRGESDGMPIADTNTRADWAQDPKDAVLGKKVMYPGWSSDAFFQTTKSSVAATVKYCVAPDNLFVCMRDEILSATQTISMEMYSLDNANVVDAITRTLDANVKVSVLLDGAAMVNQGKWACAAIERHGGECWIMASKPQANIHKRYDSEHGKWMIVDHARVSIGSENMGDDAMPADVSSDGTFGTRGGYMISDDAELVNAAQAILENDFDPAHHADVRRWGTNTDDFPPFDFVPVYQDGGSKYKVQFPNPLVLNGMFPTELVECPDNCLRTSDALLEMVTKAGAGDTLSVEQLYEYPFWGAGASNPVDDPNLRLEAYIAAAKRGARVRILLDSYYDVFSDPRSNFEACAYVNALENRYDIECRLANPMGLGIHMKMVLVEKGGTGFVHLGSINGSETSNKLNRELATQVESLAAEQYWKGVFEYDWGTTTFAPHKLYLPLIEHQRH